MPELVPEDLPLVTAQTAVEIQQNHERLCDHCEHEQSRPVISDEAWFARRKAVIECGRHSGIRECCIAFFVNEWLPYIDEDLCHPKVEWRHRIMDRMTDLGIKFGFVPCDGCLLQARTLPPLSPCPETCAMWKRSLESQQARLYKVKYRELEKAVDDLLDGRLELDNFAVDLAERFIASEFIPNLSETCPVNKLAHRVLTLAAELQLHCASTIAHMKEQDEAELQRMTEQAEKGE